MNYPYVFANAVSLMLLKAAAHGSRASTLTYPYAWLHSVSLAQLAGLGVDFKELVVMSG